MPTPANQLRAILNERLPYLTELTFGCRFLTEYHAHRIIGVDNRAYPMCMDGVESDEYNPAKDEMRGHDASIYDIVLALGEDWAMDGKGQLLFHRKSLKSWNGWTIRNHVVIPYPQLNPSLSAYEQDPEVLEEILKLFK